MSVLTIIRYFFAFVMKISLKGAKEVRKVKRAVCTP